MNIEHSTHAIRKDHHKVYTKCIRDSTYTYLQTQLAEQAAPEKAHLLVLGRSIKFCEWRWKVDPDGPGKRRRAGRELSVFGF